MCQEEKPAVRVAMAYFRACLKNQRKMRGQTCQVSTSAEDGLLYLTCSCGVACILDFSEETTAELLASLSLTDLPAAVLGAIQQGNLMLLCLPWPTNTPFLKNGDISDWLRSADLPRPAGSEEKRVCFTDLAL